ncbi:hypothetical protein LXL04_033797 [Taraxacum kok-saghyz]
MMMHLLVVSKHNIYWIMDSTTSFHASNFMNIMKNIRHYNVKVRPADNKCLGLRYNAYELTTQDQKVGMSTAHFIFFGGGYLYYVTFIDDCKRKRRRGKMLRERRFGWRLTVLIEVFLTCIEPLMMKMLRAEEQAAGFMRMTMRKLKKEIQKLKEAEARSLAVRARRDWSKSVYLFTRNSGEDWSQSAKSTKAEVGRGSDLGIMMMKAVRKTPQLNGVTERINRNLSERAKIMRLHSGLSKMLWANLRQVRGKDKKCTFIDYNVDNMNYRLWDNQNKWDAVGAYEHETSGSYEGETENEIEIKLPPLHRS